MKASKTQVDKAPYGFVVGVDTFLSGWGLAEGGRSLYALPVASTREAGVVLANMRAREEFRNERFVISLAEVWLRPGDHLTVARREEAARWYRRGAFLRGGS